MVKGHVICNHDAGQQMLWGEIPWVPYVSFSCPLPSVHVVRKHSSHTLYAHRVLSLISLPLKVRHTSRCRVPCCLLSMVALLFVCPVTSLLISLLAVPAGLLYIYLFVPVHLLWTFGRRHNPGRRTSGSRYSLINDALFVPKYGATDDTQTAA